MPSAELIAYVKDVSRKGFSHEEIRKVLIKSGYSESDVDFALSLVPVQLSFSHRMRLVLANPLSLFAQIRDEAPQKSVAFLLITGVLSGLLVIVPAFVVVTLFFSDLLPELFYNQSVVLAAIVILAAWVVFFIGVSFVHAVLVHAFAQLLGGSGSFSESLKAVSHASGVTLPGLVICLIPYAGFVLAELWFLALTVVGVGALYGLSRVRAIVSVVLPYVLYGVVLWLVLFSQGVPAVGFAVAAPACVLRDGEWCSVGSSGQSCGSRDDCLTYVAVDQESVSACEQIENSERRDICIGTLAINLGDVSVCKKAQDRAGCEDFFVLVKNGLPR